MHALNKVTRQLLELFIQEDVLNYDSLIKTFGFSQKTLSKEIDALNRVLEEENTRIIRKQGIGMWLEGYKDERYLSLLLNQEPVIDFQDSKSRMYYLVFMLLNSRDYITMESLSEELYVSRSTLVNDIKKVDTWFLKQGVDLTKKRAKGIKIQTKEIKRREAMASLYKTLRTNRKLLNMIRRLRLGRNISKIDSYVASDLFNRFDTFDIDTLRLIVRNLEEKTTIRFSDEGFAAIVIHIAIAIKRAKEGHWIELSSSTVKRLKEHNEFETALKFLKKIEENFNVSMPEDEACYILMHMLGAKVLSEPESLNQAFSKDLMSTVNGMLKKSETLLDVSLVHDDVLVKSLALHIKTLINRLENNLPINNPYLNTIKTEYPMVFEAAIYGYETMKEKYGFAYNDHEIAYIAMYIQAAIERSNSMKPRLKKRILIVCSSGIGTAQLVTSKFKRLFKDTEVVNTTSLLELDKINKKEIDLIVSTFSIDHTEVPCVSVSPFLNDKDIQRIETALEKTKTSETQMPFKGFTRLLDKRFLKVHSRHTDYNRLLKSMIDVLTRESRVTEKFHETVLKREALSSTAILDVTIPHGDYKEVIQDTMMVWTLSKPIKYGSSNIKIVIMLALRKETTKSLQSFYDSLYAIIDNGNIKEKILKVKDKESLYMTLFKGDKPS